MQCEQNTSWQNGEPRNSSLVALLGKLHFKFLAQGFVWLAPGKLFNIFINPVGALEPTLIEEDHPLNAICHQQFYSFQLNLFSVSPIFPPSIPPIHFLADYFPVISNILWLLRYSGAAGCETPEGINSPILFQILIDNINPGWIQMAAKAP